MKSKNKAKKLYFRIKDWEKGVTSREGKVHLRWESKGYHKPGSNKK